MKRLLLSFIFFFGVAGAPIRTAMAEETSPTLNLEEILREAVEKNLEILAAEKREHAAEERIPQARAWDDPQIGVTQWSIPSNFNVGKADETWYTLSQSFSFFGKRALRGGVATLDRSMASEEARGVRLRVVRETKQAYYDLFFARKALDIHHEQEELTRKFSQIAQEKFSVGAVGQQDVLRAQVELLNLVNHLETLEQDVETAEARLNTLLDRPPGGAPLGLPQPPAFPAVEPTLETLQREAEEARPENRTQVLAIQKGKESVQLAKRDLYPDVTAEVAYWDVHDGANRWMASIKINIPWVNKKKYEARVRENEAEESRAKATHQAVINQTHLRVKELFARLENSKRLVKLYRSGLLPLAEQSLEAAAIGYQTKKNDFLTLIDAQKSLKDLELTYFSGLTEIQKTLAELEEMTEKGF